MYYAMTLPYSDEWAESSYLVRFSRMDVRNAWVDVNPTQRVAVSRKEAIRVFPAKAFDSRFDRQCWYYTPNWGYSGIGIDECLLHPRNTSY